MYCYFLYGVGDFFIGLGFFGVPAWGVAWLDIYNVEGAIGQHSGVCSDASAEGEGLSGLVVSEWDFWVCASLVIVICAFVFI